MSEQLEEAVTAIERIQKFDVKGIVRKAQLGDMSFEESVDAAERVKRLFSGIQTQYLNELSPEKLNELRSHALNAYTILNSAVTLVQGSPEFYTTRKNIIDQIHALYGSTFNAVYATIAFLSTRQTDFEAVARDARAAAQSALDAGNNMREDLQKKVEEAETALSKIRDVAAEQGVSQQAHYFRDEAIKHEESSKSWKTWTIISGWILISVSGLSLSMLIIEPRDTFAIINLLSTKLLIFAVLAYAVIFCSKNYQSNQHNAVVNRHRQNGLLTFNVLVEAANSDDRKAVILTYAASAIFSPQDTGYTKPGNSDSSPTKIVEILPKLTGSSSAG